MAEKEYQRLTWSRMRRTGLITAFATRSSLWLGKDHLLGIDSTGYAEEYKRFYFRDIQAFTLAETKRRAIWNWILGVPLVGCVGAWGIDLLSNSGMSSGGIVAGIVVTLLFAVPLVLNNFYGPTCTCHLRTAVQTELLPSLNRLRRAREILNRIRPLIEEAQGRLSPEEIAANLTNPIAPSAPPVIASYKEASPRAEPPPRHYPGTAHTFLFWFLLADVPLTAIYVFFHSSWMDLLSALTLLATVGLTIRSLVKQHHTILPVGLKRIPWMVLGWTALVLVAAMAYGIVLAVNNPDAVGRSLSPLDDPVVLLMTLISTAGTAAMGVAGLFLLRGYRAANQPTVAASPMAEPSE